MMSDARACERARYKEDVNRLDRFEQAVEGGRWDEALRVAAEDPEDMLLANGASAVHGIQIGLRRNATVRTTLLAHLEEG